MITLKTPKGQEITSLSQLQILLQSLSGNRELQFSQKCESCSGCGVVLTSHGIRITTELGTLRLSSTSSHPTKEAALLHTEFALNLVCRLLRVGYRITKIDATFSSNMRKVYSRIMTRFNEEHGEEKLRRDAATYLKMHLPRYTLLYAHADVLGRRMLKQEPKPKGPVAKLVHRTMRQTLVEL